jgi:hypothetical protein
MLLKKRVTHMSMSLRHPEILDLIRASGHVEVDELATRFGVSVQTIRAIYPILPKWGGSNVYMAGQF